jgi:hypothetical protein
VFDLEVFPWALPIGRPGDRTASPNRTGFPRLQAPVYFRTARLRAARKRMVEWGPRGLRVYSDDCIKAGTRLDIDILDEHGETMNCLVRVVWCDNLGDNAPARFDLGLEVLNVDPLCAQRLSETLGRLSF